MHCGECLGNDFHQGPDSVNGQWIKSNSTARRVIPTQKAVEDIYIHDIYIYSMIFEIGYIVYYSSMYDLIRIMIGMIYAVTDT